MAEPSRTQVLDDAVSSTVDTYVRNTPADVVYQHTLAFKLLWNTEQDQGSSGPALSMKKLGVMTPRVKTQGGRIAVIPTGYHTGTSFSTFRGAQKLTTPIDPVMTLQSSLWAHHQFYVGITFQEAIENSGDEAIVDILQGRVDMEYRAASTALEAAFWANVGDVAVGSQETIPGVRNYISTSPTTGNVWGIDRATYTWQRNAYDTVGSFATNGIDKMRSMRATISGTNGLDPPSIWVTTPTVWGYAGKALEAVYRVVDYHDDADLGIGQTIRHLGIPIAYTSVQTSGRMDAWNLNYWDLLVHKLSNWKVVKLPYPNDQLIDQQWRVTWSGTWGIERFDRQGVLSSITA